jgi:hypothetical protein
MIANIRAGESLLSTIYRAFSFETQLQTAWVSFRQQMRVTFAGPEGGSAKLVNDRSRPLLPGQDGRFSGNPIVRKDRR